MTARQVKEFLATQDIQWDGKYRSFLHNVVWEANLDEPLKMSKLRFEIDGKTEDKSLLLTDKTFFIFNFDGTDFEKDLTRAWQKYLSEQKELEEENEKENI
ncbi:MAG: hypothetical protein IJZ62_00655 [Clostridia bacterium]|nr:hypothetical protein [Clostridia bacterium]